MNREPVPSISVRRSKREWSGAHHLLPRRQTCLDGPVEAAMKEAWNLPPLRL